MTDTQILDFITQTGTSILRHSQPDMGGWDWTITNPMLPSSQRVRARNPRQGVEIAAERIRQLGYVMKYATSTGEPS